MTSGKGPGKRTGAGGARGARPARTASGARKVSQSRPRPGTKPKAKSKKPPKSSARKWIKRSVIGVIILFVIAPILGFMTAYVLVDVPEPDQLVSKQVSNIYAADGSTEIARIVPPEGNRVQVNIDQIPPSLQSAVVAAEDREFYTNRGFSLSGFARAALGQLTWRFHGWWWLHHYVAVREERRGRR